MLVIHDAWYIAAPSSVLRQRPIRRSVEGLPLAVFRGRDGKPRALVDRCAHRGMALSEGRVREGCIECPYHGWRFDGTGTVTHVPALCEGESMPESRSMRSYVAVEQDGQIWIWLGREAPTGRPFHFPHCGEKGWSSFFMHTRFQAPVEACLENFLDVPHTIFVHPGLFRGGEQSPTSVRITRMPDSVVAEFLDEPELKGFGPRLLFPRGTRMRHTDRFVLPSISCVEYAFGDRHRFVITSQCTQRDERVVDVTTAITWRLPVPRWMAHAFLRPYCRKVIQQDVEILDVLGRQIERFGTTATQTSADLVGRHISALRSVAAEGGSPLAELERETVLRI